MSYEEAYQAQRKAIEKKYGKEAAASANYGWGIAHNHMETKVYATKEMKHTVIVVSKYKGTNSKQISHTWYRYRGGLLAFPMEDTPKATIHAR